MAVRHTATDTKVYCDTGSDFAHCSSVVTMPGDRFEFEIHGYAMNTYGWITYRDHHDRLRIMCDGCAEALASMEDDDA